MNTPFCTFCKIDEIENINQLFFECSLANNSWCCIEEWIRCMFDWFGKYKKRDL